MKKIDPTSNIVVIIFFLLIFGSIAITLSVKHLTNLNFLTASVIQDDGTTAPPDPVPPILGPKHQRSDKFYAPILMYHHISDTMPAGPYVVRPATFEKQMAWLKDNNYTVISYSQFYEALTTQSPLPEKPVVLTFDDNDKDQYENALPILQKYNYKAIFFVPTAYVNVRGGVMTWDMLKTLLSDGMEIGCHSSTHPDLRVIPLKQLYDEELIGSKKILEKNLGISIKFFAYPGGAKSKSVVKAVEDTGYLSAVTTFYTPDHTYDENPYKVSRIYVDNNMDNFKDFIVGKNLYKSH